jgi:hypothetical protein
MATRGFGRIIERDLGWKHVKAQSAILAKGPQAVIGIRGEEASAAKQVAEGEPASSMTLAEVATVHEYGSPSAGIPERSFIRSTVDENLPTYRQMLAGLRTKIFDPKSGMEVRQALLILGQKVKLDIQTKIRAGMSPPWADSTREKRIARAGGAIIAETPLIDTGQLVGGITNDAQFKDGSKI